MMIYKHLVNILPEPDLSEIVFEGRNKIYGAYVLRKDVPRLLFASMWFVILIFIIGTGSGLLLTLLNRPSSDEIKAPKIVQVSQLSEPPSIVETRHEKINASAPQKVFTSPKITKDEDVKKETIFKNPDAPSSLKESDIIELKEDLKKSEAPKIEISQIYFVVVDFMPEPLGDIQSKLSYPQEALDAGVEGRVFIKAFIDENGTVKDTQVIKGIGYGCDEAAQNAVRRTRFKPGKHKGNPVKVQMTVQVTFRS